jgi:Protein of unknown function (DUF1207)
VRAGLIVHQLGAAMVIAQAGAAVQTPAPSERPAALLFQPLIADPKEPRFFATYLWTRSSRLASRLGSVGLGQTIGLVRGREWQLGIGAAVFSEFNMQSSTTDLLNTDYVVGLPLTYRHGSLATRLRLFHQSSHLGDEYMAHTNARRIDLTFQAVELLVARETTRWRVYGGGDYIFAHSPTDLKPGVLHGGLEFRQPGSLLRLGGGTAGRVVAGLDVKSIQDRGWQVGWSMVTGLELGDPQSDAGSGWRWSVLLKAYTGPAPYGEFFRDYVSSLGVGVGFTL